LFERAMTVLGLLVAARFDRKFRKERDTLVALRASLMPHDIREEEHDAR
jgi:hypothetical protein